MSEIKKIPARSEIAVEDTWATEDLYPSDEAWQAELASMEGAKEVFASYAGRLGESGQTLYEYLHYDEEQGETFSRLANYCMRKADEDTRNATYQAMRGQFMGIAVAMGAVRSFETPEIMAIPDEKLEQFYKDFPALERYRRALTDLRRMKDHTLSPAEEKLLAASGEMGGAPQNIYGSFANADITFADAVDSKGKIIFLLSINLIFLL